MKSEKKLFLIIIIIISTLQFNLIYSLIYSGERLITAARYDKINEVKELIKKVDINYQDKKQSTALLEASEMDNYEIVKLLLENGADPNIIDDRKVSPLEIASQKNHIEIVKILLQYKANVNNKNIHGQNGLHYAAFFNHDKVIKLLAQAGADVDIKDNHEKSPMHYALRKGYQDPMQALIEVGADIKGPMGQDVLHWAIINEELDLVNALIEKDIDIFCLNSSKERAFDLAKKIKKKQKIMPILLRKIKTKIFNFIKMGDYNKIKELSQKISMGIYDENKNNPLHIAATNNKIKIFNLILSIRPELIKEVNNQNKTPLDINPAFDNYNYLQQILMNNSN